jgi:hypothetical protein
LSFPSLKRPIRRLARGAVESDTPPYVGAALGGLGSLSLDRTQGRQDSFQICTLWLYLFLCIDATFLMYINSKIG